MITTRILILSSLLGASALLASCGGKAEPNAPLGPQAVSVTTALVTSGAVSYSLSYPGTIVPFNETELRAEVSGYLTGIHVADGARVHQGQSLYEIDRVRYTSARDQAQANLSIAQSNLQRIRTDLGRYEELDKKNAIAKQTLDYAKTDLSNAEAQVASAQAALTTAQTNLNRSVIKAPFAGVVGISQVRQGALVSAGSTLLNTISSLNPMLVEFSINEKDINYFIELQKSSEKSDSLISIRLPDGSVYPHFGRVETIDRAIDPQTGTLRIRARFENPDGKLRAGMNASVQVLNQVETPQLLIPYKAIQEQLGETIVYVVLPDSTVEQRGIHTGIKTGQDIVVTEGLKEGETIITEGLLNLRNGSRITTAAAAARPPAPAK